MKLIFAGTPIFAERHLQALIDRNHEIVAVYTQPDRPAGRGKQLLSSPVKQLAEAHGLAVMQPLSFKEEPDREVLAGFGADLMVVVAYGILLPESILETPKYGCINVHGSILPRWRGAAPIQRAIEAGDEQSGVTIMQMDKGLDTGDMLLKSYCEVLETDSSADLHDRLAEIGPPALLEVLTQIENGNINPEKQNDLHSNYASKISKDEALIDWHEPAELVARKIRAFNPFPIAYSFLKEARIKIYDAEPNSKNPDGSNPGQIELIKSGISVTCGEGSLLIKKLQAPGKKAMDVHSYLNGINHSLPASSFSKLPSN